MTSRQSTVTALAGLVLCLMMAAPVRADNDHHWHGRHRGHWEHRERAHAYRPYYHRSYSYEPGGYYYYTPPPVYVAPPPSSFGLNLVFPLHFR